MNSRCLHTADRHETVSQTKGRWSPLPPSQSSEKTELSAPEQRTDSTRHPQFDSARHEGEKTLRVCGEARWATGERRAWAWAESETGGGEGRAHSLSRVGFEGGNPRGRPNYRGSGRRARWRAGA